MLQAIKFYMLFASLNRDDFVLPSSSLETESPWFWVYFTLNCFTCLPFKEGDLPAFPCSGRMAFERVYFIRSTLGGSTRWLLVTCFAESYPCACCWNQSFVLLTDGFEGSSRSRKAGFEQMLSEHWPSMISGKRRFVFIGPLQPAVSVGSFTVRHYMEGSTVSKFIFPWADT